MEGIQIGDIVKVRIMADEIPERVWCIVLDTNVEAQTLKLEINNTPTNPAFKLGEILTDIPVEYVLDKWRDTK